MRRNCFSLPMLSTNLIFRIFQLEPSDLSLFMGVKVLSCQFALIIYPHHSSSICRINYSCISRPTNPSEMQGPEFNVVFQPELCTTVAQLQPLVPVIICKYLLLVQCTFSLFTSGKRD